MTYADIRTWRTKTGVQAPAMSYLPAAGSRDPTQSAASHPIRSTDDLHKTLHRYAFLYTQHLIQKIFDRLASIHRVPSSRF
jgi:hypothetical protein